jgi:anti-sigma regulatory factor (Ser/Thr protein kinase)
VTTTRSTLLPATLKSPAAARQFVRDAITESGIAVDVDDATIAVSEIVSNVVCHAGTSMRLDVDAGPALRVAVTDSRPDLQLPVHTESGLLATGGRGLFVVGVLVSRWGQSRDARMKTKTVWFEIDPRTRPG